MEELGGKVAGGQISVDLGEEEADVQAQGAVDRSRIDNPDVEG